MDLSHRYRGRYVEIASFASYKEADDFTRYLISRDFPGQYVMVVASGLLPAENNKQPSFARVLWLLGCVIGIAGATGLLTGAIARATGFPGPGISSTTILAGLVACAIVVIAGVALSPIFRTDASADDDGFSARFFDVVVHPQYTTIAREIVATSQYVDEVVGSAKMLRDQFVTSESLRHRASTRTAGAPN